MKISLNWLKDYIDLKAISVEEIVTKITVSGLEVEEVEYQAKQFENFVVGFVKEKGKHPNADKLSLCSIFDGKEDLKVVCGAQNVEAGQKIAFAKVGAIIPNGNFQIGAVKIRGEESFGMICSEKELGISDNHAGILVLDDKFEAGLPLADALEMNDVILDIAITPNRADALSHIGIARELSAIFNKDIIYPEVQLKRSKKKSNEIAKVEIKDVNGCGRFIGKVVENVEVKESPDWLKKRLKNIGLRSINNVVDVTNYVMHEIGQPMHAYDLDLLKGRKIIVRKAFDNESFTTLDSKERKLANTDLMICDAENSVGIAGVMGGENSEVTSATKNLLIESAFFNASMVRKTSRKLGLSTDASYRFERGADPEITVWAARRAAQLISELSGGLPASGEIDIYPVKIKKQVVNLRYSRIEKILGYKILKKDVVRILTKLGFEIEALDSDKYKVKIPTYRRDVEREIDLIEEVARVYGFDKVPEIEKISIVLEKKVDDSSYSEKIRTMLVGMGFNEIMTNSLIEKENASKFGKPIGMMNPQNSDMSHLRPSLFPGMFSTISKNIKVKEKDLSLFEIGKVFFKNEDIPENEIVSFDQFSEQNHLLVAMTGSTNQDEWYQKKEELDIYHIKGVAEEFIAKFRISEFLKEEFEVENNLLDESIIYKYNGVEAARIGKVKKNIIKIFDIEQNIFIFELNIDIFQSIKPFYREFSELLRYPKVVRDIALVLDENISSKEVISEIKEIGSNLLHHIKLFDIFRSESLGQGKKSIAFQLEFYNELKTLTEEEVEKEFWQIIKVLEKKV